MNPETDTLIDAPACTCDSMDEHCQKDADAGGVGTHCVHWWDGDGPCCRCGSATCPAVDKETGEHP